MSNAQEQAQQPMTNLSIDDFKNELADMALERLVLKKQIRDLELKLKHRDQVIQELHSELKR